MRLLVTLTTVEIVIFLGALAWYLIAITRSLASSSGSLGKVTFGVRAIEQQTASIGPNVVKINGQLEIVEGVLAGLAEKAEKLTG
jgi:hypothetical protein